MKPRELVVVIALLVFLLLLELAFELMCLVMIPIQMLCGTFDRKQLAGEFPLLMPFIK